MRTESVTLSATEWTELTLGSTRLIIDSVGSTSFLLHFSIAASQPNGDAVAHRVKSFPPRFDFSSTELQAGQRVWAKAITEPTILTVSRDVDAFGLFIPSGSDRLITDDGNVFRVLEG